MSHNDTNNMKQARINKISTSSSISTGSTSPQRLSSSRRRRHKRQRTFMVDFQRYYTHWIKNTLSPFSSILLAVILWYSLGVISIGTSKYLLMSHNSDSDDHNKYINKTLVIGNLPALYLTLQQLCLGSLLLRTLLHFRFLDSAGLQHLPRQEQQQSSSSYYFSLSSHSDGPVKDNASTLVHQIINSLSAWRGAPRSLIIAAVCFCGGFALTNCGFQASSAAFVETIKAAEPLTSATLAVAYGIESLQQSEILSLAAIVAGVLLSTIGGHQQPPSQLNSDNATTAASSAMITSVMACSIVMASNLCFSLRGLYQKLLRATPQGSTQTLDDLNLQFRMQQLGFTVLFIPVLFWDGPYILSTLWQYKHSLSLTLVCKYFLLSLINGCAFTCYNLASTFILSRISVVHHAALNCLRRIFAIIVTSIIFAVPITFLGLIGILISVIGFMCFTYFKVQKQKQSTSLTPSTSMTLMKMEP